MLCIKANPCAYLFKLYRSCQLVGSTQIINTQVDYSYILVHSTVGRIMMRAHGNARTSVHIKPQSFVPWLRVYAKLAWGFVKAERNDLHWLMENPFASAYLTMKFWDLIPSLSYERSKSEKLTQNFALFLILACYFCHNYWPDKHWMTNFTPKWSLMGCLTDATKFVRFNCELCNLWLLEHVYVRNSR